MNTEVKYVNTYGLRFYRAYLNLIAQTVFVIINIFINKYVKDV